MQQVLIINVNRLAKTPTIGAANVELAGLTFHQPTPLSSWFLQEHQVGWMVIGVRLTAVPRSAKWLYFR